MHFILWYYGYGERVADESCAGENIPTLTGYTTDDNHSEHATNLQLYNLSL